MKKILTFVIIILISVLSTIASPKKEEPKKTNNDKEKIETNSSSKPVEVIDENSFKKELQETVLEFINDLNMNPDSCYVPFRDKK